MNMPIGDAAKLLRINLPIAAARFLSSLYAWAATPAGFALLGQRSSNGWSELDEKEQRKALDAAAGKGCCACGCEFVRNSKSETRDTAVYYVFSIYFLRAIYISL